MCFGLVFYGEEKEMPDQVIQKKLTDDQRKWVQCCMSRADSLVHFLSKLCIPIPQELTAINIRLREMDTFGTTDGKPWIDPEPPIPPGYRKALPDEWRRKDVKFWSYSLKDWCKRPAQVSRFDPPHIGTHYIVPIDPPLTDRDAAQWPRLLVMVRDNDTEPWEGPFRYVGRYDENKPFPLIVYRKDGLASVWKYARRATPAEIEAAK